MSVDSVVKNNNSDGQSDKKNVKSAFVSKLIITVLLSLAAPLTVCVFGPFEIFAANLDEFRFSLMDFLPYMLLFALGAAAVIFAALIFLKGIAFDIGCGIVTWLSVMLFVQRNYLNLFMGNSFLAGDGNNASDIGAGTVILNTAIWLIVGASLISAVIIFRKKHIEVVKTVTVIAMIALIGMQSVSFAITSITSPTFEPILETEGGQKVLTYKNLGEMSKGKNIVFFLVDRFDADYYEEMVKKDPDFFDGLDGFTHFNDYTSLYARTYPGVASILTGKDHDYFSKKTKAQKLEAFYSDGGGMMGVLKENGYEINVYGEKGYDYTDASVMDDYVNNVSGGAKYYIDNNFALAKDMLLLSLSQYLPTVASFGWAEKLSTPLFNDHAIYEADGEEMFNVSTGATATLTDRLKNTEFSSVSGKGQFTFIHLYGCHDIYNASSEKSRETLYAALEETFELINYYIAQMKAEGVYKDATIIITGDHASALSDSKMIGSAYSKDDGTRVTAMLFKKSGDEGTPLATSAAQISQDELWNTIFESEGLLDEKNGDSFFDIPEGENRERRYIFEMFKNSKNNDLEYNRVYEYKIIGNANLSESWEIVKETDVIK